MIVIKFGGTSVGSSTAIRQVIDIISKRNDQQELVIVVSALGGVTDLLIKTAKQAEAGDEDYKQALKAIEQKHFDAITDLLNKNRLSGILAHVKSLFNDLEDILQGVYLVRELSPKSLDVVGSYGERISSYIIHEAFREAGLENTLLDSRTVIHTDRTYNNAKVDFTKTDTAIQAHFKTHKGLHIVPGFVASAANGDTTTLGRGGSDYTAAIYAAALNAKALEIWTDVDGVMTANPRSVKKAMPISTLSYEEAMELSYFGAKVIYPPTIQPALAKRIPLWIKNTFNPSAHGTLIGENITDNEHPVKGISSIDKISLLTLSGSGMVGIPGTSARLFSALARNRISVILISQASSEHSISIAINQPNMEAAKAAIEEEFGLEIQTGKIDPVGLDDHLSIVAIVGQNMRHLPGIAGKLFSSLGKNGINIIAIAQGTSELNISFVVKQAEENKALNVLHEAFFLSDTKSVHVFLTGVGTVGGALLKQIEQQYAYLKEKLSLDIKVAGLSNSRQMVLNEDGINLSDWQQALKEGEKADIQHYIDRIINLNLRNSIFVDCTANEVVGTSYNKLLDNNISVVAANKVAASGDYDEYWTLNHTAAKRGVRFLYETNVGAGLPVLSTLNDLVKSGDAIQKIEAVLSGTMNYIFNNVGTSKPFSVVVQEAKDKGYAEPDPRIDLSGKDVARKILILAREAGYRLEMEDVEIVPFLPKEVFTASEDGFWKVLQDNDPVFEQTRAKLAAEGKKYRLVASFDGQKAKVQLYEVGPEHPFYHLEGSDSIVLFITARYNPNPLVVKGAGAGAEVTAAGVFADIIRIVN